MNSASSAYPQMIQASPRVQVVNGEYPCCYEGHLYDPSLTLNIDSWATRPRTS